MEQVAAVDDEVDLAGEGRGEGALVAGQEVLPPTPSLDARAQGVVEAHVGVAEQQQPHWTLGAKLCERLEQHAELLLRDQATGRDDDGGGAGREPRIVDGLGEAGLRIVGDDRVVDGLKARAPIPGAGASCCARS